MVYYSDVIVCGNYPFINHGVKAMTTLEANSSYAQSTSLIKFLPAFLSAQAEMEALEKNKVNEYFKNNYADLAEVLKVCKPALNKHQIVIMFFPCSGNGVIGVETRLIHSSGEWMANTVYSPLPKQDPQGVGIVITYLRRYGLTALTALAQEDKDGNMPGEQPPHKQKQQSPEQKFLNKSNTQQKPETSPKPFDIDSIYSEIKQQIDPLDFIHFMNEVMPKKNLHKDIKKIVFNMSIEHAQTIGLVYWPAKKTFINKEDAAEMGETLMMKADANATH